MLVVMGPTIGVPVNMLYSAAFGPGFLLAGLYIVYCMVRSFCNPTLGPPVPKEERVGDAWLVVKEVLIGVLPLAALIGFTLGHHPRRSRHADGSGFLRRLRRHGAGAALWPAHARQRSRTLPWPPW